MELDSDHHIIKEEEKKKVVNKGKLSTKLTLAFSLLVV